MNATRTFNRAFHRTHPFNGPLSGTTRVSRYQKGKTNLDFTEARDSGRQWHQLDRMQVCTSLQTDNHASTPPLSFLQAGCPSCRPTNSVKALKAKPSTNKLIMPVSEFFIVSSRRIRMTDFFRTYELSLSAVVFAHDSPNSPLVYIVTVGNNNRSVHA